MSNTSQSLWSLAFTQVLTIYLCWRKMWVLIRCRLSLWPAVKERVWSKSWWYMETDAQEISGANLRGSGGYKPSVFVIDLTLRKSKLLLSLCKTFILQVETMHQKLIFYPPVETGQEDTSTFFDEWMCKEPLHRGRMKAA